MPRLDWLSRTKRPTRRVVATPQSLAEVLEARSLLSATAGLDDGGGDAASPYFSEDELREYLLNLAQQRFGGLFGQTIPQYDYGWRYPGMEDVVFAMDAGPMARTTASGSITSDTNTQVDGVDEADFVETDGRYLYVARGRGLTILDTLGESGLTSIAEVELTGNVVGAFLFGDRLTVIAESGLNGGWYRGPVGLARVADMAWWGGGNWNPQTTVTVFDVSDRTAPRIVDQTILDGNYRDARAVEGIVYVVIENQFNVPEPLFTDSPPTAEQLASPPQEFSEEEFEEVVDKIEFAVWPTRWDWWNPTLIANRTYESFDDYVARVGDQIANLSLPHAFSVDADGNSTDLGPLASADNLVRSHSEEQQSLLTIVSIDTTNDSVGSAVASSTNCILPPSSNTIYMTRDAIYVATSEWQSDQWNGASLGGFSTRIDRFAIDGTTVTWQATGLVAGTLINQFAMDEHDGYLHIATHTWARKFVGLSPNGWANYEIQNDNGVYVLDTDGDTLDEVGSLTGLAPGEQLFAARFLGDTAYLVTFLQTDPLFAIDLSDPANPTLQGELVIPGFSNYLQSVGEGLLLGIGQERETGTWHTRLHASLFDVSDGTNLTQIARQFLEETSQWSSSDAQYDHHALLYSAEDGLLVLPVSSYGYEENEDGTINFHFEQLLEVLHVDASGIQSLGEIRTGEPILRTVRIDNVLYAISETSVTAVSLDDFSVVGQAGLLVSYEPEFWPIYTVFRGNTGAGGGTENTGTETDVVIPPASMLIAMPSGPADGGMASTNFIAMAAQFAQNTANDLARVGTLLVTSDNDLSVNNSETDEFEAPILDSEMPSADADESSDSPMETSRNSNTKTMDEFWEQVGERLRQGEEPMSPSAQTSDSNAKPTPNAEKSAAKPDAPNSRSATEGRTPSDRSTEMSQSQRPTRRDAKVARAAKSSSARSNAATKSSRLG